MKRSYVLIFVYSLCVVMAGIADVPIQWPEPPAAPRIQFISEFSSPDEFRGREKSVGAFLRRILIGPEDRSIAQAYGIAVHESTVFVADTANHAIHVFNGKNGRYRQISTAGKAPIDSPVGVSTHEDGTVYVSDSEGKQIHAYDKKLNHLFSFGADEKVERPTGIACHGENIYVADTISHRILVYQHRADGVRYLFSFGSRGTGMGLFNFPVDVAVSHEGLVYINDSMNFRIQVFDSEGTFLRMVGSAGDSSGHFQRPKGIALDSDGNMYVADALADTIQVFNRNGDFLLNFGTAGSDAGQFWLPAGMAIDESDRIFVADSSNHRIQVFQYIKEHSDEE